MCPQPAQVNDDHVVPTRRQPEADGKQGGGEQRHDNPPPPQPPGPAGSDQDQQVPTRARRASDETVYEELDATGEPSVENPLSAEAEEMNEEADQNFGGRPLSPRLQEHGFGTAEQDAQHYNRVVNNLHILMAQRRSNNISLADSDSDDESDIETFQ